MNYFGLDNANEEANIIIEKNLVTSDQRNFGSCIENVSLHDIEKPWN